MALEQPFTTAPPFGVNFDFNDIADGTGYEQYFLCREEDSTGKGEFLINSSIVYSSEIVISIGEDANLDLDFDLTAFKFSRTMEGDVFVQLWWSAIQSVAGPTWGTLNITAKLRKFDGTTETEIGSVIAPGWTLSSTALKKDVWTMKIPVTKTKFAQGDILRLTLEITTNAPNGVGAWTVGIDPANRASSPDNTFSNVLIPFDIDV